MEDLVDRSAYDALDSEMCARLPVALAAGGGILVPLVILGLAPRSRHDLLGVALVSIVAGVVLLVVGLLYALLGRFAFRFMRSRAYAGTGMYAASPPQDRPATHRCVCSLRRWPWAPIGGALFLDASTKEVTFVACWWFRRALRFTLGESGARSVAKGVMRGLRDRALGASACDLVLVDTEGASHRFMVPDPSRTAQLIVEAFAAGGPTRA